MKTGDRVDPLPRNCFVGLRSFCKGKGKDEIMEILPAESFSELLVQLRNGDKLAVNEFVFKYEPFLRRSIRFRIGKSNLQPVADSVDVCQSVLSSFFFRLTAGDFELATEADMRHLLFAIAKRKFLMLHRHESAGKRSRENTCSLSNVPELAARDSCDPCSQVTCVELMSEVAKRMPKHEHELLERRLDGQTWSEIAIVFSEDKIVLRKRLSRAMKKVALELGLIYE